MLVLNQDFSIHKCSPKKVSTVAQDKINFSSFVKEAIDAGEYYIEQGYSETNPATRLHRTIQVQATVVIKTKENFDAYADSMSLGHRHIDPELLTGFCGVGFDHPELNEFFASIPEKYRNITNFCNLLQKKGNGYIQLWYKNNWDLGFMVMCAQTGRHFYSSSSTLRTIHINTEIVEKAWKQHVIEREAKLDAKCLQDWEADLAGIELKNQRVEKLPVLNPKAKVQELDIRGFNNVFVEVVSGEYFRIYGIKQCTRIVDNRSKRVLGTEECHIDFYQYFDRVFHVNESVIQRAYDEPAVLRKCAAKTIQVEEPYRSKNSMLRWERVVRNNWKGTLTPREISYTLNLSN